MSDIGILPTKTNVRVTSSTGKAGDIPAADESHAGAMTAAQVKTLNELAVWKEGIETGSDRNGTGVDVITRKELQAELAKAASPLVRVAPGSTPEPVEPTVGPRVDAIEHRVAAIETAANANVEALANRLQAIEHSARRSGSAASGLTSGEIEKLVASLVDAKLALQKSHAPSRDFTPEITTLGAKVDDLAKVVLYLSQNQPEQLQATADTWQPMLAQVTEVIKSQADIEDRLHKLEVVMQSLKMIAAHKVEEAAA